MHRQMLILAFVGVLGFPSCGSHSPSWKISHGKYKSKDWYVATLSSSSIRGVGQKATLSLAFDGNSLSQATKPRKDITMPEECSVGIALPCPVTAQEKWKGVVTRVEFDKGGPKSIGWVWEKQFPENEVALDGLTPGGNAGFIAAVERHRSLRLVVPCGAYDSSRVEFNIQGLEKSLISAGMKK